MAALDQYLCVEIPIKYMIWLITMTIIKLPDRTIGKMYMKLKIENQLEI